MASHSPVRTNNDPRDTREGAREAAREAARDMELSGLNLRRGGPASRSQREIFMQSPRRPDYRVLKKCDQCRICRWSLVVGREPNGLRDGTTLDALRYTPAA